MQKDKRYLLVNVVLGWPPSEIVVDTLTADRPLAADAAREIPFRRNAILSPSASSPSVHRKSPMKGLLLFGRVRSLPSSDGDGNRSSDFCGQIALYPYLGFNKPRSVSTAGWSVSSWTIL